MALLGLVGIMKDILMLDTVTIINSDTPLILGLIHGRVNS
ncbi:hypothetical protein MICAH_3280004 [Microcystis aeruginosa PCC 9809]|uniref:Uncharacterized protein n=1 Tax=Microcystis aeruginosa PCC 9809 TaxID=1160285 RepID=I4HSE3_MICAE|nr:hypothetical protein MICAH_3280004 [Microcystis aeruginosa PCC 9809]